MERKKYIKKLDEILTGVEKLAAEHCACVLTDGDDMETARHKSTSKTFEALRQKLYDDGAVSARIMADNAAAGKGEQGDLFDGGEHPEVRDDAAAEAPTVGDPDFGGSGITAEDMRIAKEAEAKRVKAKKAAKKPGKKGAK